MNMTTVFYILMNKNFNATHIAHKNKNIAASSDAGSSTKWQNTINMYTVEDRDLDNKRAKLLHVWSTTIG